MLRKGFLIFTAFMMMLCGLLPGTSAAETPCQIPFRFADKAEAEALIVDHPEYYGLFTQNDLEYRLHTPGATTDDYLAAAKASVQDFTEDEKTALADTMARLEKILSDNGYVLPQIGEIVFVKVDTAFEIDSSAYTLGNQIFFHPMILEAVVNGELILDYILCHELFHVFTRNDPQFKKDMYGVIGFTVNDVPFEVHPSVKDQLVHNPDVGAPCAYASFTVNGEQKDCYMSLAVSAPFAETNANMMNAMSIVLIPVDEPDKMYPIDQVPDFYTRMGNNTGYVIDPEECLADNFGFAIAFGLTPPEGLSYANPEILEDILMLLKK